MKLSISSSSAKDALENGDVGDKIVVLVKNSFWPAEILGQSSDYFKVRIKRMGTITVRKDQKHILGFVSDEYKAKEQNIPPTGIDFFDLSKWVRPHKKDVGNETKFKIGEKIVIFMQGKSRITSKYWLAKISNIKDGKYWLLPDNGARIQLPVDSNLIIGKVISKHQATNLPKGHKGIREEDVPLWIGTDNFTHHLTGKKPELTNEEDLTIKDIRDLERQAAKTIEEQPKATIDALREKEEVFMEPAKGTKFVVFADGKYWSAKLKNSLAGKYVMTLANGEDFVFDKNSDKIIGQAVDAYANKIAKNGILEKNVSKWVGTEDFKHHLSEKTGQTKQVEPDVVEQSGPPIGTKFVVIDKYDLYWPARLVKIDQMMYTFKLADGTTGKYHKDSPRIAGVVNDEYKNKTVGKNSNGIPEGRVVKWLESGNVLPPSIQPEKKPSGVDNTVTDSDDSGVVHRTYKVGDRIVAFVGGEYWPANIISDDGDSYKVQWDDGEEDSYQKTSDELIAKVTGRYGKRQASSDTGIPEKSVPHWTNTKLFKHHISGEDLRKRKAAGTKQRIKPDVGTTQKDAVSKGYSVGDRIVAFVGGEYWPANIISDDGDSYKVQWDDGEEDSYRKDSNMITGKILSRFTKRQPKTKTGINEESVNQWIGTEKFKHHIADGQKEGPVSEPTPSKQLEDYKIGDRLVILTGGEYWTAEVDRIGKDSYTVRWDDDPTEVETIERTSGKIVGRVEPDYLDDDIVDDTGISKSDLADWVSASDLKNHLKFVDTIKKQEPVVAPVKPVEPEPVEPDTFEDVEEVVEPVKPVEPEPVEDVEEVVEPVKPVEPEPVEPDTFEGDDDMPEPEELEEKPRIIKQKKAKGYSEGDTVIANIDGGNFPVTIQKVEGDIVTVTTEDGFDSVVDQSDIKGHVHDAFLGVPVPVGGIDDDELDDWLESSDTEKEEPVTVSIVEDAENKLLDLADRVSSIGVGGKKFSKTTIVEELENLVKLVRSL